MKTSTQILLDAADLIESGRWTQGKAIEDRPDGVACFCAIGALQAASMPFIPNTRAEWEKYWEQEYVSESSNDIFEPFEEAISRTRLVLPNFTSSIIAFNDRIAESASEVAAVLRAAAATPYDDSDEV